MLQHFSIVSCGVINIINNPGITPMNMTTSNAVKHPLLFLSI